MEGGWVEKRCSAQNTKIVEEGSGSKASPPPPTNITAEKPQIVFFLRNEKFRQLAVCLLVLLRILARAIAEQSLNKLYKELLSLFASYIIGNSVQDFLGPVIIH